MPGAARVTNARRDPFKAMTTFGDELDFKHFLPRILELCAVDQPGAHYDVDVILQKLEYASWTSWPEREVRALRRFVATWRSNFAATLQETKGDPWQLESLDEAFGASGFGVQGTDQNAESPFGIHQTRRRAANSDGVEVAGRG